MQEASLEVASKTVFLLGTRAFIVFLAFLNSFVPLSIDLYLPALPTMAKLFSVPAETISLTLSLFVIFFALSMLVWGPLSDRLGRRKILFAGLALYVGASFLCFQAQSINQLIFGRVVQALGCGAIQAVSMAIVKDVFSGRTMENVLVWIQILLVVCPLLAPVLGAFLLNYISWQGLFGILFLCGVLGLVGLLALKETLVEPLQTPVWAVMSRIGFVLRNRGLRYLLVIFSLSSMSYMTYLSTSSFIYVDMFKTTEEVYSYFFAGNAFAFILGPLAYMFIFRKLPRTFFIGACLILPALAGLLLTFFGNFGPFIFAALFMPTSFFGNTSKPLATVLMMSQLDSDNGTVASLIGSAWLLFGGLSILICSLDWSNPILAVGAISFASCLLGFILWLYVNQQKAYRP